MLLLAPLQMAHIRLVTRILAGMITTSRILDSQNYIQHGTTTIFRHSQNVAYMSLLLAKTFHWNIDEKSLIRGALLHDYFLYDWHDKTSCPKLHGFFHPAIALANAKICYTLTTVEEDIILHHMFPLTLLPPKTKEGFLITISDKLCSLYETFNHKKKSKL